MCVYARKEGGKERREGGRERVRGAIENSNVGSPSGICAPVVQTIIERRNTLKLVSLQR